MGHEKKGANRRLDEDKMSDAQQGSEASCKLRGLFQTTPIRTDQI